LLEQITRGRRSSSFFSGYTVVVVECHDILSQLWSKATAEEEIQSLREIEPNFQRDANDYFSGGDLNLWALETNIAPFLRFPITDGLTVAESINAIFSTNIDPSLEVLIKSRQERLPTSGARMNFP
jgi:hypothetical protein